MFSRLDPTLAYPVAIRPSAFEHGRFIDKMQPGYPRIKTETYYETPYQDEFVPSGMCTKIFDINGFMWKLIIRLSSELVFGTDMFRIKIKVAIPYHSL